MNTPRILTLSAILSWPLTAAQAQEVPSIPGKVTLVTLYRGQALTTRDVEIPADRQGAMEIIVPDLPSAVDPKSVFTDAARGVEIRSVTARARKVDDQAAASEAAQLDEAIRQKRHVVNTKTNEIALRRLRQDYLRKLEDFVAPTAELEITRGLLNADQLERLVTMHFREYEKASDDVLNRDFELEADHKELSQLENQRTVLAASRPASFEAVVYLEKADAGAASFRLNYLVNDCGWSPAYNFRGDSAKNEVALEFNALIHQVSGEDWRDVRLALSTASPVVSAFNPQLTPFHVRVAAGADSAALNQAQQQGGNPAGWSRNAAFQAQAKAASKQELLTANFMVNDSAAGLQMLELSARSLRGGDLSGAEDEEVSVVYQLDKSVSLISRREPQFVRVLDHASATKFYHVATPVLSSRVFREAELTNGSGHDLLGGPVNVYLDGQFTGRTEIPTVASGQTFALSFGVDSQLRARRQLLERDETTQGGNRQIAFSYEVVIDSFKSQPTRVLLRDRTPHTENQNSLRVAFGDTSSPLSADPSYVRFEKPKGILLWELDVPPGAARNASVLRYAYTVEFDKNMGLQDVSQEEKKRLREAYINQEKLTKPTYK